LILCLFLSGVRPGGVLTHVLTHVLGVAYVASTPLGFVGVFWAMAGKVVLVLADAETGLDAEA
jgi:hypothetical protein